MCFRGNFFSRTVHKRQYDCTLVLKYEDHFLANWMSDSEDKNAVETDEANGSEKEEERKEEDIISDNKNKDERSVDCDDTQKEDISDEPSIRPSASVDKQQKQMMAELCRLRKQMKDTKQSIERPTVVPYTPDIFNDLSPYYNAFMVDHTIHELQQDTRVKMGFGRRATALGIVDPQISLKMDSFPGPFQPSRVPGTLFRSKTLSRSTTRNLPPIPMPCVPKFYQSQYQPNKMNYSQLTAFRFDMQNMFQKLVQRREQVDYDKTVRAWHQMSLSELKRLPVHSKDHMNRTILSYLGTSRGSHRALRPLTRELLGTTTEPN